MKQRTLQLFQLFLLIFTFYALTKYTGNQRWLVSLACLATAFLIGKVETDVAERRKQESRPKEDTGKKDEKKTISQAVDWLLKSKNVVLLTDAIQHLLHDLGVVVSPSPDNPAIERLISIPGDRMTWGLTILGDVSELNENWEDWEALEGFDQGRGGKRRVLIICNNAVENAGGGKQKFRHFSADAQALLSDRQIVAMTTLTLCKIYLSCKKREADIKTVFDAMGAHPGGVFQLESLAK